MKADHHRFTTARWTALVLLAACVSVLALFKMGIPAEPLSLWVVGIGAPATTLFVLLYFFTVRWTETWIGRALMVSSTGFAALLDLALANRVLPPNYPGQQEAILLVLVFMSAGGWLKLIALLRDKVPLWMGHRLRRTGVDSKSRP